MTAGSSLHWLYAQLLVASWLISSAEALSLLSDVHSSSPNQYVAGQRCRLVPSSSSSPSSEPPLILLCGLGQNIGTYEPHLVALARHRDVLVYEGLGQGPVAVPTTTPSNSEADKDDNKPLHHSNVTLPRQAEVLMRTLDNTLFPSACSQSNIPPLSQQKATYDIVGFSLGGRIGMAAAALFPERIRSLHLTGVAADRSPGGHVALAAWRDVLRAHHEEKKHQHDDSNNNNNNNNDDDLSSSSSTLLLRGFGWLALQTSYSPHFLHANQERLPGWVDRLCETNSVEGLRALLQQAYPTDQHGDDWHVCSMARRIAQQNQQQQEGKGTTGAVVRGCLLVGDADVMAPVAEAKRLADELGWNLDVMGGNVGHGVPTERPREWRNHVLDFLNGQDH